MTASGSAPADTAGAETVERVAQAIFATANPITEAFPDYWERVVGGEMTRNAYRRQAAAALAAMQGPDVVAEAEQRGRREGAAEALEAAADDLHLNISVVGRKGLRARAAALRDGAR